MPLLNTEYGFDFRLKLENWLSRFKLPGSGFIGILAFLLIKGGNMMAHVVDKKICLGCGACVAQCSQSAIVEDGGQYKILKSKCTDCGNCVAACPANAISKK